LPTSGARILLPGTIYNYGPDAFPVLREDSPQHASTHKGKIRIALEEKLQAAAGRGVRSLIVRLGDFFGPNTKLVRFLGKEPHTPLQAAVEATLRGMGCLG